MHIRRILPEELQDLPAWVVSVRHSMPLTQAQRKIGRLAPFVSQYVQELSVARYFSSEVSLVKENVNFNSLATCLQAPAKWQQPIGVIQAQTNTAAVAYHPQTPSPPRHVCASVLLLPRNLAGPSLIHTLQASATSQLHISV